MTNKLASFNEYQAKYESSFLPESMGKRWKGFKMGVHRLVAIVDEHVQLPELTIRTLQLGTTILSCFPSVDPLLEMPRQLCKDAKNFTNFLKGVKSIDGFLNFKFTVRHIVLNVSGMTLFILSGISLVDRFRLLDVSVVKIGLSTIPVFGILPFGGLLSLSLLGLLGSVAVLSLEKQQKLQKEIERIKEEKLAFWKQLDLSKVQERQRKYEKRISELGKEVEAYQKLKTEGEESARKLNAHPEQIKERNACQKALQEINRALQERQQKLDLYQKKLSQWKTLEDQWEQMNPQKLKEFCQAKEKKWQAKLSKIHYEKRTNLFSLVTNATVISRQVLTIVPVMLGYGLVTLPLALNVGLEVVGSGSGVKSFFMKKSLKKMKISPAVDLTEYCLLTSTVGEK
jgi:hypothetical protein